MEQIRWMVDFNSLGKTEVAARNWYGAVKAAAIKLGLRDKYPMTFLGGLASVTKVSPLTSGRKKKYTNLI